MSVLTLGVAPGDKFEPTSEVKPRPAKRSSTAFQQAAKDFRSLLLEIQKWTLENAANISKVYLLIDPVMINLYVIAKSKEYDYTLRAILSDLVVSLRDKGNSVRGTQIPDGEPEELQGFFDLRAALLLSTQ